MSSIWVPSTWHYAWHIHMFSKVIHSFNIYLLSTYSTPGTILSIETRQKTLTCSRSLYSMWRETNQLVKCVICSIVINTSGKKNQRKNSGLERWVRLQFYLGNWGRPYWKCDQKLINDEGLSCVHMWGKSFLGRRSRKCKVPEAGMCLVCVKMPGRLEGLVRNVRGGK